jgi:protein SCO1
MRFSTEQGAWAQSAASVALAWVIALHASAVHSFDSPARPREEADRPFELTNQSGEQVSDKTFRGKWLLVYFGFTSCADVCPASMTELAEALRLLGADAERLRVVFITVDPERDSPGVLSRYLANFSASFTGLTGTRAQIAQVLATFDAYAAAEPNGGDGYRVGHSSSFYLLDPGGHFQRRVSPETGPLVLSTILRRMVTAP